MANWKEGDRVRVVTREATMQDKMENRYFDHMAGLVGTIQNVYEGNDVAVRVDLDKLSKVSFDVHSEATKRLRAKFMDSVSEEAKSKLTTEEKNFVPNYMILVKADDLEKVPG